MPMMPMRLYYSVLAVFLCLLGEPIIAYAQDAPQTGIDAAIERAIRPIANALSEFIFFSVKTQTQMSRLSSFGS